MPDSHSNAVRWSGLASTLGGMLLSVLFAVVLFMPEAVGSPFVALFLYVWVFLLVGLTGLYARQRERYGEVAKWLARIGLVLAMIGSLQSIFLGLLPFLFMGFGLVLMSITTAFLFMGLGLVLIGIATIKGSVLRWRALPLLMGICGIAAWYAGQLGADGSLPWNIGVQALVTLFGAGWVLLGYTLWSGKGLPASQD